VTREELAQRHRYILKMVIERYLSSGRPVASEHLLETGELDVSAATIRNELACLEEEGLLTHPYTSAGRIPTDHGFRIYVDSLMESESLSGSEQQAVKRVLGEQISEFEEVVRIAPRILSALSSHIGFVALPEIEDCIIREIRMVPLGTGDFLMVLVTSPGVVKHSIIRTHAADAGKRIGQFCDSLNERIAGRTLVEAREWLENSLDKLHETGDIFEIAARLLRHTLEEEMFYIDGASIYPRKALESIINRLLQGNQQFADTEIFIGEEIFPGELSGLSLVAGSYGFGGRMRGMLGIIGPKAMKYRKITSIVDYVRKQVDSIIQNMIQG
jgi:heat-inducible transcriptional repressor